jgi:hypothetical protein
MSRIKVVPFAFENLAPAGDPGRGPTQVRLEQEALANLHNRDRRRRRPKVIADVECIHRPMPMLAGYQLVRDTRDLSHANVALYVRDGLHIGGVKWTMCTKTWPRPEHPDAGPHEPRVILAVRVEDWTFVVAHAPQVAPKTGPAREEWLDVLEQVIKQAPAKVLCLSDPNGLGDDLARRMPNLTTSKESTPTDAAHARGADLEDVRFLRDVNGIRMLTDHHGALLGRAVA